MDQTEQIKSVSEKEASIRTIAKAMSGFGRMILETADALQNPQGVMVPLELMYGIGTFLRWGGENLLSNVTQDA